MPLLTGIALGTLVGWVSTTFSGWFFEEVVNESHIVDVSDTPCVQHDETVTVGANNTRVPSSLDRRRICWERT